MLMIPRRVTRDYLRDLMPRLAGLLNVPGMDFEESEKGHVRLYVSDNDGNWHNTRSDFVSKREMAAYISGIYEGLSGIPRMKDFTWDRGAGKDISTDRLFFLVAEDYKASSWDGDKPMATVYDLREQQPNAKIIVAFMMGQARIIQRYSPAIGDFRTLAVSQNPNS